MLPVPRHLGHTGDMSDERDEIRRRINLVDLVAQRVTLKQHGKVWKGLCPFHNDRNPSFQVDPAMGRYVCWACGEKGDCFDWVQKNLNVGFREALEVLARDTGVVLKGYDGPSKVERLRYEDAMEEAMRFFRSEIDRSTAALSYCERRGLDSATLATWEVGYAPDVGDALASRLRRNGFQLAECQTLFLVEGDSGAGYRDKFRGRLIFPIRDEQGKLVAFGGRLLGEGHPKYINSGDTPMYRKSKVLYGMNRAKEPMASSRRGVLVEGYLDVVACHRAGLDSAVASLGTSLTQEQARLLKRWCERVTVLYDADEAGAKAADRAADVLQAEGLAVEIALMPPGEDPDTLLRAAGAGAVVAAAEGGVAPIAHRLAQLELRVTPSEDGYWEEAFEVLAGARSPMELDRFSVLLASKYPYTRDSVQAQKSIRRGVDAKRRELRSRAHGAAPSQAVVVHRVAQTPVDLNTAERAVLLAFLEPELCARAWDVFREGDRFFTRSGVVLSTTIAGVFLDAPPVGQPRDWLHLIEDDDVRELIEAVRAHAVRPESAGAPPSLEVLVDALGDLRRLRRGRYVEDVKKGSLDDDRLREITHVLKGAEPNVEPKTR